jgi:hypothetical protein
MVEDAFIRRECDDRACSLYTENSRERGDRIQTLTVKTIAQNFGMRNSIALTELLTGSMYR